MIVKPLNELTSGYLPPKTLRKLKEKGKDCKGTLTLFSHITHLWSEQCQKAFNTIIEKLTSPPVLGFADLSSPFILHTDASNIGLGVCLYQKQNGKLIAYASRGLSKSEINYPAHKKEFLALKWAVTKKFDDYLYGGKFTVITDNNPLTYVMSSAKLDAIGYRWLAALSTFDFDLQYRLGLNHQDADGLGRRPQGSPQSDDEYDSTLHDISWLASRVRPTVAPSDTVHITCTAMNAILSSHKATEGRPHTFEGTTNYIEMLTTDSRAIPDEF